VLRAFGLTDKGRIRPTNEDCFAIEEGLGLCVIADGMGGHNAGEVAARLAVDAIVEIVGGRESHVDAAAWPFGYDPTLSAEGNLLRTAVHLANVQILETAMTDTRYAGMGTTIVAARVTDGVLSVAHVGDSRLYVFAGQRLRAMTLDDSWMATVLAQDPKVTDVHVVEAPLAGGELLLLTTDGVHGVLDEPRIIELLQADEEPRAIANSLIASALIRGSRDNCTAIVARYEA
jgi:serine/threonine protein phosphatase PrpC